MNSVITMAFLVAFAPIQQLYFKTNMLVKRALGMQVAREANQDLNGQKNPEKSISGQLVSESLWHVQMRQKLQVISPADRKKAIHFLEKSFDSLIEQKITHFSKAQYFDRIELNSYKLLQILTALSHELSSHAEQKAVLIMILATSVASSSDQAKMESLSDTKIGFIVNFFESKQGRFVPSGDHFKIVMNDKRQIDGKFLERQL